MLAVFFLHDGRLCALVKKVRMCHQGVVVATIIKTGSIPRIYR